jgi:hypothetical protein
MKKLLYHISTFATFTLLLVSCQKYETFQSNPNQPSNSSAALQLTGICNSIFYRDNTSAAYATRHLTYYERGNVNVDYSWQQNSFDNYNVLRQVMIMDSLAKKDNQPQYLGLTKLFRAVLFAELTEIFGDIPYTDALKGFSGNFEPKYDRQESIYAGILQELEEANNLLDDNKGTIVGDIIYSGTATKWKRFANAYKLRLLIHLSKKESNTTLNIKQQFQNIISNPTKYPLFTGNADNAQMVFNTSAPNNYYPTFGSLSVATLVSMEKGLVTLLKDRQDPRLFAFADPVGTKPADDFNSYGGVDAGQVISVQFSQSSSASRIKARYYNDQVNEPMIYMGYSEQELLIAEAISRGWVTGAGTAKSHYDNAITASMSFYGISGTAVADYLSGPSVAFNTGTALQQIAIQKHIALFMKGNWEAFFEQRRTGIPALSVGPGTRNGGVVPKRWVYPQSERDYNSANLASAIQAQYNGDDNVNSVMWLLQ